jgi:tetraprenyl-beta-curcumene synthase
VLTDRRSLYALRALAAANARFWPTVAPTVHRELSSWEAPATAIGDPSLRSLALEKLRDERFNAEVAATLATLAPARSRTASTQAIVALELLFDYLDGRTEHLPDPLSESAPLFAPFTGAVHDPSDLGPALNETVPAEDTPADWEYLQALSSRTQDGFCSLPAAHVVRPFALAAAQRCAQAQTRIHALPSAGLPQLEQWAREHSPATGLDWREYTSGCASSVLAVHALIAAAADPICSPTDAQKLDAAYLAIGAVITILDSLVDHPEDTARGEPGFNALFSNPRELLDALRVLTREALARSWEAPNGAHHAMTLAGVAAYYTTHPDAAIPTARPVTSMVRRELSPTIWPTLAVMRSWRAAKLIRARARAAAGVACDRPVRRPADVE